MEESEMNALVTEIRGMREQLIRLDERMNMVQDHEVRLRGLERWRYALPTSMVIAFASLVAALAPLLSGK